MYCENCGNKIQEGYIFCTKCGNKTDHNSNMNLSEKTPIISNDRWWKRLLKVLYVFLYLQVLWIIPAVWIENKSSYVGYYLGQSQYEDTYGQAFWYALLTLVIFVVITRLIKITVLYVAMGVKPNWKKEFRKIY
jgi:uncharacterized membrane protein